MTTFSNNKDLIDKLWLDECFAGIPKTHTLVNKAIEIVEMLQVSDEDYDDPAIIAELLSYQTLDD